MCDNCLFFKDNFCMIKQSKTKEECFLKEEGELSEEDNTNDIDFSLVICIPTEYIDGRRENKAL